MNKGKEIFSGILIILSFAWIGIGIGMVIKSEVVFLSVEGLKNVGMLISMLISIFFATQSSRRKRREFRKEEKRNKKMAKKQRKQDKKEKKEEKRVVRKRKKKKLNKKVKKEMRRIKNKKITLKSKQIEQQLKTGNTMIYIQPKNQLNQSHKIETLNSHLQNDLKEGDLNDNAICHLNNEIQCDNKMIFKFKKFTDESSSVYLIIDDEFVFLNLSSEGDACELSMRSHRIPFECITRVMLLECDFPKVVMIRMFVKNRDEHESQQDHSLDMILVYDELEQGRRATKEIEQKVKNSFKKSVKSEG